MRGHYYIGIDLGGMSAKAGIMNADGEFLGTKRCFTDKDRSPEETAKDIAELATSLAAQTGVPLHEVVGIGIGSPGVIDSRNGIVVRWTNFNWQGVRLAKMVRENSSLPVFVTNDANAAALGEAKFGSGTRFKSSVMITLGTGVGGGMIFDGKLFEGYRSAGAEIGHMVIEEGGILCTCGRRGCFEQYASATALIRDTKKAMLENRISLMWDIVGNNIDNVDGETAFLAAKQGDMSGTKVIKNYIWHLGEGIANIVNLLRPEAIILGGGISNQGDYLIRPLQKFVYDKIYVDLGYAPLSIVKASLGNDAGIYGAIAYVKDRMEL